MEIRHLRLIKAIVEEGSITKAIDKLHLTQSLDVQLNICVWSSRQVVSVLVWLNSNSGHRLPWRS